MDLTHIQSIIQLSKVQQLSRNELIQKSTELASALLKAGIAGTSQAEKQRQQHIARMIGREKNKHFVLAMTDQCFRSHCPARIAGQLNYLLRKYGTPTFLNPFQKIGFWLFRHVGRHFPFISVPLIQWAIEKEYQKVIIPGEIGPLLKHIRERQKENAIMNLNHLGEAVLGEEEALNRIETYLRDLASEDIRYISIKISTIYSQINPVAWEETLEVLAHRLRRLYRAALLYGKFVNLDMEEYRDLRMTVDLFKRVLDEPEFISLSAGIALQSYLPDSFFIQQELTLWAMRRKAMGGAPVKIRLVKGANLAMEKVEASMRLWPLATYPNKRDVDANYKRMLDYAFEPEHAAAMNVGVASHNLFDIAYALLLRAQNHVEEYVQFEMLEGMAEPIRRVVQTLSESMVLYCPAAKKEEFQNAVAYLFRRLDESSGKNNFLRCLLHMPPTAQSWKEQADYFTLSSYHELPKAYSANREQNRAVETAVQEPRAIDEPFINEPDTDWSLPQNALWGHRILQQWKNHTYEHVPVVMGKEEVSLPELKRTGIDPSAPQQILYEYVCAKEEHIATAIKTAIEGGDLWRTKSVEERASILANAASLLRVERGTLIGAMAANVGKSIVEGDAEVSEAIDFAEYYLRAGLQAEAMEDIRWLPIGITLVASPWNFPCSIPAGGILASLAAGNPVIFKPAPEAVYVGWQLARILWNAGVPKETLQFFPCEDEPTASLLVKHPLVQGMILTGATETARKILQMAPGINLMAETGGKNALIVTAMADRDLAAKHTIQSAFGYAGQKCSACSLLILEEEVYNDTQFLKQLKDAAESLCVDSQWNPQAFITPLIRPPSKELRRALTTLEEGEFWLVKPEQKDGNPHLWSPGIKMGVSPGGFMHSTELFGPMLAVLKAKNLKHAVEIANSTRYGLTSGLHSLDEREQLHWIEHIEAGNLYINRTITGAIVQRQPFGGLKDSSFGPGAKAGGPNYVFQLMQAQQESLPTEKSDVPHEVKELEALIRKHITEEQHHIWNASVTSYAFHWKNTFSKSHDPSGIRGQDNILQYIPKKGIYLRIEQNGDVFDAARVLACAAIAQVPIRISVSPEIAIGFPDAKVEPLSRLLEHPCGIVRTLSPLPQDLHEALVAKGIVINAKPVLANGRIEMLNYLREVAISIDYHRYGNLGDREEDEHEAYD